MITGMQPYTRKVFLFSLFYYISFKVFLNPTSVLWSLPHQVHVILIILFIGDLTVLFHLLISTVVWCCFSKEVLLVGEVLFFCGVFLFPFGRLDRPYDLTYFKLLLLFSSLGFSGVKLNIGRNAWVLSLTFL